MSRKDNPRNIRRILLINPRILTTPSYPLGLLYIASVLEKDGHKVKLLDLIDDDITEKALRFKPDMIGITISTMQVPKAIRIADMIKEQLNVSIIAGGIHVTASPKEILKEKSIDMVVIGEGEMTFREIALGIPKKKTTGIGYKKGGRMHFTKPRPLIDDLNSLPFPAYHLLKSDIYFKPPKMRGTWSKMTGCIMASRGCPYHCIYCASHLIFGRKVRRRSIENVMDEIEYLRRTRGITAIYFLDDTFTTDASWVKDFSRELLKRKWKGFEWGCQARVNTVLDPVMLRLMKESGCCQVDIGIESGSQRVLNILRKGITVEQIYEAFDLLKKIGIRTFTSWIIGTPGETREDMQETLMILERIKPDYADFNFLVPYPGTELSKNKMCWADDGSRRDYEDYMTNKLVERPVVSFNDNAEEMVEFRALLYRKSVVRNYMPMVMKPSNMLGVLNIFMKGFGGLRTAIPRFMRDGNLDGLIQGMLAEYRRKELLCQN